MTILDKQDEAREEFLSICESLGVRREESWIIVHLSIYGRSSVKDISYGIPSVSRRWLNELLQKMIARKAISPDGNDGRRAFYKLNLDNSSIESLTSGFRTRDRKARRSRKTRRSENEWKLLVMGEIEKLDNGSFEVKRSELVRALSKTRVSDSRLSQIIGKLIKDKRIERLKGRGYACYKPIMRPADQETSELL